MDNLHKIRKDLVILKQRMTSLAGIEPFLNNRDWEIYAATDLGKALSYIVQYRPNFLMLPADHPDARLSSLPRVLSQAYPICVLHYLEFPNSRNIHLLNQIKSDYILPTPVSGPSIERMAFKYFQGSPALLNRSNLPRRNMDPATASEFSKDSLGTSKEIQDEMAYLIQLLSHPSAEEVATGPSEPKGPQSKDILSSKESFSIRPNLEGKGTKEEVAHLEVEINKKPKAIIIEKSLTEATEDDKYLMLRGGTSDALINVVEPPFTENVVPITEITNVACITIESTRFSGYLIAAMGKDRQIDEDFINTVQNRLLDFLRKKERNVHERAALDLVLRRVAFEPWAEDCAKFLVKSVHQGEDVAMAFFPHSEINYKLAESASEEMAAISIEYLSEDSPTAFNVYMYMPVNDKYILYTPKGGRFYNNQRDRLKDKGVTHMHIQKTDIPEFGKYRVQSHLNSQIREHQEQQQKRRKKKTA